MSELTQDQPLEHQLEAAKVALTAILAKRDEARAGLAAAEEKRRHEARTSFLGDLTATKAKKDTAATRMAIATRERDDAARLFEDVELAVEEARAAVSRIENAIHAQNIRTIWAEAVTMGKRRADLLEKIVALNRDIYAAVDAYRAAGRQIFPVAARALRIPRQPDISAQCDHNRVAGFIGTDAERLALLLTESMPIDILMRIPRGERPAFRDWVDQEYNFWSSVEID
ncbi:MAG: hypothetical protein ACLQUZ_15650 [Rhizomicrobium sp.]